MTRNEETAALIKERTRAREAEHKRMAKKILIEEMTTHMVSLAELAFALHVAEQQLGKEVTLAQAEAWAKEVDNEQATV